MKQDDQTETKFNLANYAYCDIHILYCYIVIAYINCVIRFFPHLLLYI